MTDLGILVGRSESDCETCERLLLQPESRAWLSLEKREKQTIGQQASRANPE